MRIPFYITLCLFCVLNNQAQNSLISIDEKNKDIGLVENIYKVNADFIINNLQNKNLYLLRADAQHGITIKSAKKTLKANDSTLITIEFIPEKTGKFSETIKLVTSADGEPFVFSLSGNIKFIKNDDKTACFYFGKPNHAGVKNNEPMSVPTNTVAKDNSNKMPGNSKSNIASNIPPKQKPESVTKPKVEEKPHTTFDESLYKPNNITFLVDVSSSMKDTMKLAVMQEALHHLINELRPQDKITFITYADSVKLLKDGVSASLKDDLHKTVSALKARGLTKGKKAILYGLDVTLKNYIGNGNNQIILATDGKFRFYPDDQKLYVQKQGDKTVLLSTLAFGNDKDALHNLKEIATIGKGHFIPIKNKAKAKEQLITEIKTNSLIN